MKLTRFGLLSGAATILTGATAQSAYLWTVDPSVHSSSTAIIDPDTASSIIARRRGLTDERYLHVADDGVLEEINRFGGYQQPLFGDGQSSDAPGKLFIRISGFDGDVHDLGKAMPDLWVVNPTRDLLDDFKASPNRQDGYCEYAVPPSLNAHNSKGVEVVFSYPLADEPSCLRASEIPYIPVIMSLHSALPSTAAGVPTSIGPLVRILKHLSAVEGVESTLVVLPSKLAEPKPRSSHNQARAASIEEEPLDLPSSAPSTTAIEKTASDRPSNITLPSVIPACFNSQSACENTTNSCSGHGNCYKAHNNCYKCKCGTTVARYNEDGTKKTVQWGGAACQKKDVSVPFVLLASFSVVMAGLVAGAIGLLYKMGSEELPSVIGAGVAGPRTQK